MSKVLARRVPLPRLSRFSWLMGLYAENHARLQRLFEPAQLGCGIYISSIGDGLDVRLEVIEQHADVREHVVTEGGNRQVALQNVLVIGVVPRELEAQRLHDAPAIGQGDEFAYLVDRRGVDGVRILLLELRRPLGLAIVGGLFVSATAYSR